MRGRLLLLLSLAVSVPAFGYNGPLPDVEALNPEPTWSQSQGQGSQNQMLQLSQTIDSLQEEVQELRGKLEEQSYQINQLKSDYQSEIASLRQSSPTKKSTSFGQDDEDSLHIPDKPIQAAPIAPPQVSKASESPSYQLGYAKLQQKSYQEAKQIFTSLVKNYPNGQYTPNAYYWLGEIGLVENDTLQAMANFAVVVQKFGAHAKASDALLKLGFIDYQSKNWSRARLYFERVMRDYPNSASSRLAQNKLQQMKTDGV